MKILKVSSFLILLATFFFSCKKEYSFENVITPAGTWQFKDTAKLYVGNIDTAYIGTSGTTKTMNLQGRSTDGSQTFLLHLYAIDSFTLTTYKASISQTDFQYYTQAKTIYNADQFIGEFIVTITAIGNNSVTGIFSGLAEDSTGAVKQITLGQFTSRINLSGNGTGSGGSGTASGILGVSAGSCTPYTPSGTYTQGITLTSANTVGVTVTVTTPGTYAISTNNVNGVSFTASGTFTTTGIQTVILVGSGTPTGSGPQTFAVTFGSSTCNFSITFAPGTAPLDYFPTTVGSNWAYGLKGGTIADSIQLKVISYAPNFGGNTYSSFIQDAVPPSGSPDSLYYRKSGLAGSKDYFEYFDTKFYGFDAGSNSPKNIEYTFLKESANLNDTWQSPSTTGTVSGIGPGTYTIYIKMTLLAKATTATSGIITSTDVDKVRYDYYISGGAIPAPTIFSVEERWFARGIGLIYNSFEDKISGTPPDIYNIGRKQVF
jgi:hypothetical protein